MRFLDYVFQSMTTILYNLTLLTKSLIKATNVMYSNNSNSYYMKAKNEFLKNANIQNHKQKNYFIALKNSNKNNEAKTKKTHISSSKFEKKENENQKGQGSCVSLSENTNQSCCCCTTQDACRIQTCCMPNTFGNKPLGEIVSNYGASNTRSPCCNFHFDSKHTAIVSKENQQNMQNTQNSSASNGFCQPKKKCSCMFTVSHLNKLKNEAPGREFFKKVLRKNRRSENKRLSLECQMCSYHCPMCFQKNMETEQYQKNPDVNHQWYCCCCPENNTTDENLKKLQVIMRKPQNKQFQKNSDVKYQWYCCCPENAENNTTNESSKKSQITMRKPRNILCQKSSDVNNQWYCCCCPENTKNNTTNESSKKSQITMRKPRNIPCQKSPHLNQWYCCCCPENKKNNKKNKSLKKSKVIKELQNKQQQLHNQVQQLQKLLQLPKTNFENFPLCNDLIDNSQEKNVKMNYYCRDFQNKPKTQKKRNNCFFGKDALLPNRGCQKFDKFGKDKNKVSIDEQMKRLLNIMLERQKGKKLKSKKSSKKKLSEILSKEPSKKKSKNRKTESSEKSRPNNLDSTKNNNKSESVDIFEQNKSIHEQNSEAYKSYGTQKNADMTSVKDDKIESKRSNNETPKDMNSGIVTKDIDKLLELMEAYKNYDLTQMFENSDA